jgi:hypothetical protein
MSTPAPVSKDSTEVLFDPHAFPEDLVTVQRKAAELYQQLRDFQTTLPWSREPHPGWDGETE